MTVSDHSTPNTLIACLHSHLNIIYVWKEVQGHVCPRPPVFWTRRKRTALRVAHIQHAGTHSALPYLALAALTFALMIQGMDVVNSQHIDVEYSPAEVISSIAMACGLLRIVSININCKIARFHDVDHLMTKHNWHIVLIQEMGVVMGVSPCPELAEC